MTISNEDLNEFNKDVVALCEETTKLHNEVKGQKDRFEQKLNQAVNAADDAQESADAASSHRTSAQSAEITAGSHANRSEQAANRAEQVAGLDTVEQAVDLALSDFAGLMSESEARAINRANEEKYTASGMVGMGNTLVALIAGKVNEGMAVSRGASSSLSGQIGLGVGANSAQPLLGESKTNYPILHIAGSTINVTSIEDTLTGYGARVKLQEVEGGTRIYDSTGDARGSGLASLDLKTDIDPKYGNFPTGTESEIIREAVGRAFEGNANNGNGRNGTSGWSASGGATVSESGGEIKLDTGSSTLNCYLVNLTPNSVTVGDEYEIEFEVVSCTDFSRFGYSDCYGSSITPISGFAKIGKYKERFTVTNPASDLRLGSYSSSGGESLVIKNLSIRKVTEEVVTHRVDAAFFEYWEEELTDPREEVMECIQSLSTTFGDTNVPTVLSTRKLSYFQQYDGQFPEVTADPNFINDRYRCVVWPDLTEPQKREIAACMGEKLFIGVNGNIVNGRLRARAIRGLGNGDWVNDDGSSSIDSTGGGYQLNFGASYDAVLPQAGSDTPIKYTTYWTGKNSTAAWGDKEKNSLGAFRPARANGGAGVREAYQGRCFMYLAATVPRPNQGAYHPDLNPQGCARIQLSTDGNPNGNDAFWNADGGAFGDNPFLNGLVNTTMGCFLWADPRCNVAGHRSGHPSGIFHNGIESGGLNGVIDWRLGAMANDSLEESAKVEAKVVNHTYRGLEKMTVTKVGTVTTTGGSVWSGGYTKLIASGQTWNLPDWQGKSQQDLGHGDSSGSQDLDGCYIVGNTGEVHPLGSFSINDMGVCYVSGTSGNVASQFTAGTYEVIIMSLVGDNLSVSGEFCNEVVFSNPAHLLVSSIYKNGWRGIWGGIPAGSAMNCVRKVIGSGRLAAVKSVAPYTENTAIGGVNETASNETPIPLLADVIYSFPMKNLAKATKPSASKPVFNANAGLLGVTVTQSHDKSTLAEAVAGVILKSDASGIITEQSNAVKFLVDEVIERIKTQDTEMVAPANGSQAVKVAVYQVSDDGQCKLGFIANTMTHNGTDWGELDEIQIPFGSQTSDTFVDKNGIAQTSMSSISAISHGWTSNHARAGAQVAGVDL